MSEVQEEALIPQVKYHRAKFHRRIMANLVDLLILATCTILLFIGVRAVAQSTSFFKENNARLNQIKLDSSLYVEDGDDLIEVMDYIANNTGLTAKMKYDEAEKAIDAFVVYAEKAIGQEGAREIEQTRADFRLGLEIADVPLYVKENGIVVYNQDTKASYAQYFELSSTQFYKTFCLGFLTTRFPDYVDITLSFSRLLVFVELPTSYGLAGILTYLVPTFIFRRGRKTFGKAIYKIGFVDSRILCPSWRRNLARFFIFYFSVLILSAVTFAIPAIISTTLMGFSKKRQGFADYMLDIQEVDTTGQTIFFNTEEALASTIDNHKPPIDFEAVSRM